MDTKRLRQRVLDLAIHGKLVPQNPQDEPASELLKRIAAEKERLIKDGKIKKSKKKDNEDLDEVPFEVPQGWVWTKLGDVVMAVTDGDHMPPPQSTTGIPFLVISDVNEGFIKFEKARFVPQKYYDNLPEIRKAERGDILFTVTGSYGIVIPVDTDVNFCFQRHIGLIKVIESREWLSYILRSQYVKHYCDEHATGTAQKTVGLETLRMLQIPLPPLAEQHRIVSEVEKYFSLIDILEESENDLQQSIQKAKSKILDLAIKGKLIEQNEEDEPASILLERIKKEDNKNEKKSKIKDTGKIYEVPFEVPQGWVWCRLGDIATLINGDRGKNYPNKNEYVSQGIPWINAGHITTSGFLSNTQMNYITEEKYNMLGSGKIRENDLVFCLRGSYGKVAKVEPYNKGAIASSLVIIRVYNEIIRNYIFHLLRSNYAKLQLSLYDNGTAQPNIAAKDVEKYCIPLPPLAEQHRIVAKIEELFTQLDNIAEALK